MSTQASVSSQLIAAVVAKGLAPLLKANGFRKHRHHFVCVGSSATSHLVVQSSQWNAPDRASFTINLWSYLPEIAAAKGEQPITEPLRQRFAHCGIRIGHLLPKPGDFWWSIASPSDVDRVASEVLSAVREFGLPYLERATTLEGIAALSGHIPGICTDPTESKAIALRLLGREPEAIVVEQALAAQREAAQFRAQAALAANSE